jgi:deoxyinosine 3'endonuclease (endonuclease V)
VGDGVGVADSGVGVAVGEGSGVASFAAVIAAVSSVGVDVGS